MAMLGKVRGLYHRDGKTISEISRLTSLSRNTVKRWLRAPAAAAPTYRRRAQANKLTPFVKRLVQMLTADAQRVKRERRTARALHGQLKAEGYSGGYTRLTDFVRGWRVAQGKLATTAAFVPLRFAAGEAFQFDWSEEGLVIGGLYRRLQVSHLKLCSSRAFWLVAYPSQGHEMLFDAHTRSFAALGGIPRRGIYDNMKTAVRCGLLQRSLGMGEGRGREERAGQPAPHLDRRGQHAVRVHRRAQRMACGALPRPLAGHAPSRA